MSKNKILLVGIGSPHGDDQFGWRVAEQVKQHVQPSDLRVRCSHTPARLLDWLEETDHLIICDACRGGQADGRAHYWIWPSPDLELCQFSGTHDLNLPTVLALAERLGRLPLRVSIHAVEVSKLDELDVISPPVAAAVGRVVQNVLTEVHAAC